MTLPGAAPLSPELSGKLREALARKGSGYVPRTHHRETSGTPKYINRLILETSPYLLQHAHNPVNWFAWGEEAFAEAGRLGRPVLLSVGYSTCHWCHVMEEESFEDPEIATFINGNFVAIKVDREERPDVDGVYMTAVQLMTGGGGWPMTVMLTPDRRPFFGGTYFPPRDGIRGARIGFLSLLQRLAEAYQKQPSTIADQADQLSRAIARASLPEPAPGMPGAEALANAVAALASRYDRVHGGFDGAPKFPRPSTFDLLLRYWRRTGDENALQIVTHSLDEMLRGGIYDQVGGGFHRYSVDAEWLVPHFEKMLYDNAQLVVTLLDAYLASGRSDLARGAEDTLEYVTREMTSPEGGFYSATDADSEGHEGLFFVWTPSQLEEVLGPERAARIGQYYGVTSRGNFEGKNILHRPASDAAAAKALRVEPTVLETEVTAARGELYRARSRRIPPLLDDKIITEWNGQMISAFAKGFLVLGKREWLERAKAAAVFVLEKMNDGPRLLRTWRAGRGQHRAVLEDYAFFIAGLLDLFEASGERRWLEAAIALEDVLEADHLDREGGGFYTAAAAASDLLVRDKPSYDGAQPSGNSVAALNLLRLYELTDRERYRNAAEGTIRALASTFKGGALAVPKLATALDYYLDRPKQIVIVWPKGVDPTPLTSAANSMFVPSRVLISAEDGPELEALARIAPIAADKHALGGKPTAYVCNRGVCERPTHDPAELIADLEKQVPLGVALPLLRIQ